MKFPRNIRQDEAVRAFIRLGGEDRAGKGSHRVVKINGQTLSVPKGTLKVGLLKRLIKVSGVQEDEFLQSI